MRTDLVRHRRHRTAPAHFVGAGRSADAGHPQLRRRPARAGIVGLRQSIFSWESWATLKRANAERAQAEADYLVAQQDLVVRTAEAYFNVLAARDTLEAAQAAHDAIGRQLEQSEKRFEVGLIAVTDVQDAKAAFDSATAALIQGKRNLATAGELPARADRRHLGHARAARRTTCRSQARIPRARRTGSSSRWNRTRASSPAGSRPTSRANRQRRARRSHPVRRLRR